LFFFFFSSRRRHTRFSRDWSSDVCSSDLNGLYVLVGSFVDSGTTNSRRNLHADSGWDGENYTGVRAAAPFAIIDTLYIGIQRLLEVNDFASLGSLEFRWSSNNLTARHPDRDFSTGEIGT